MPGAGRDALDGRYVRRGAGSVALVGLYGCGERDVSLLMADTREAGELRAGYVPGEDCQGADIRARGLAWAQCHLKGGDIGDGERGYGANSFAPDASLGRHTEVRLWNVSPLTIIARDIPRAQLPGLRRSDTCTHRETPSSTTK